MGDPVSMTLAGVSLGSKLLSIPTSVAATNTAKQAAEIGAQGALISAEGAKFSSEAEANAYTYKSALALRNKEFADTSAKYATDIAEATAQKTGLQGKFTIGQIRAQQGASGLRTDVGTAPKVVESEEAIVSYEEAAIRSDGARQAYGLTIEGLNYQAESDFDKVASDNAIKEGEFKVAAFDTQAAGYKVQESAAGVQGFSSLLGAAGSLSDSALKFYRSGVFGGSSTPSADTG